MIACDYECAHHGRFEIFEEREPYEERDCPECGQPSPFCFPAPVVTSKIANISTGRSEPPPGYLSTSALADGMSTSDFKAELAKRRKERIRRHVRSKIG